MNKLLSFIKKMLIAIGVLLVIGIIAVAFLIWYTFFDCTGLDLYKDQTISEIILTDYNIYLITEDNSLYMAGGYHGRSRKYLNSEFHKNRKYGTPSPVKVFDQEIKDFIVCPKNKIMIITQSNELYSLKDTKSDIKSERIAGNICCVDSHNVDEKYYVYLVDIYGILKRMDENGESVILASDIVEVHTYRERVFVLNSDGDLVELIIADDMSIKTSEPLFSNVKSFDVKDTSLRFDGEKYIYDDQTAQDTPLFNVLTNDDKLYAKGAYSLLYSTRVLGFEPSPYVIEEWEMLDEHVVDFSLSHNGTLMLLDDSRCSYYGYDPINNERSYRKYNCTYYIIPIQNVTKISSSTSGVCVKGQDNNFYFWGANFFFNFYSDERNTEFSLFENKPFVLTP